MDERYIYYEANGKRYKISESQSAEFEKDAPNAKINYSVNGKNYLIGIGDRDEFLRDVGDAGWSYTDFDAPKAEEKKPTEKTFMDKVIAANDSLSRAQFGATKTIADEQIANMTAPKMDVDEDMASIVMNSHAENKSRILDFMGASEREFAERKSAEPREKMSFWESIAANPQQSSLAINEKEMGADYSDAKIALNISNKTEDKVNQYLNPSKTFLGGAAKGIADTVSDLDTWDSTIGAEQASRVYAITKKLDAGKELTEGEEMIVNALVDDLASDMYLASGFGRGYKAGRVTGESLPFMLETMLNPASGMGEAITKKFGKSIFKKVASKLGTKAARAAVHGTRIASDIAGASIMSATTSQARVAADALNRLSGQVDFKVNEKDGTLEFNGFTGGEDSTFKAYAKAFGANTIEHFSEMVGNYFAPIGEMTKSGAITLANKVGLKRVGQLMEEMTPNGFGAFINDFAEQTQWHGMIGEFAEEIISGAMNALVVGDQTLKKYDKDGNINQNYLFEKDNLIDTFLGVAILGGVMSTAKTLGYTTPENRYNREIERAKKGLSSLISDKDMKTLEAFASNPFGADYANLEPFFGENRSEESKIAVARYLKAVMAKQGYMVSREADLSGTQQGMNEMQNAYRVGQNMTEADLYDVSEEEANAMDALERTGFFNRMAQQGYVFTQEEVAGYDSYNVFSVSEKKDIGLTAEERDALKNLALVRNAKEGLNNKLNGITNAAISFHNNISTNAATDGTLTVGFHNGKKVYIKGGVQVANGAIVKPADVSGYPVEIVDANTGESTTVDSSEVSTVGTIGVEDYNNLMAESISNAYQQRYDGWRNTKSAKSKLAEIQQFVGQKVYIQTANNAMAEVEVQQILPNGEVLISGKKGDLGGQSTIRVDVDSFYDSMSRDANGNPIFNQSGFRSQSQGIADAQNRMYVQGQKARDAKKPTSQTPTAQQGETAEQTAEPAVPESPQPEAPQTEEPEVAPEIEDYREGTYTVLIDGVPTEVEVVGQDNTSDTIVYRYTDENGFSRTRTTGITGFRNMLREAEEATTQPAPAPTTETPQGETTTTEQGTSEPTEQTEEPINWETLLDFEPDTYLAEMQKRHGDKVVKMLNAVIDATQKQLDKLNKTTPESQEEIFQNEVKKDILQSRIDKLNDMVARLTATPEEAVNEPTTPEAPTNPEASAEPITTENGFIIVDKVITNPEVIEMPNTPEGDANRIFIGEYNGKWEFGAEALLDNKSWGKTPEMRIELARFDTREEAIAAGIDYLERHWKDRYKDAGSTKLDEFIEYVRKTYLQGETPTAPENEGTTPVAPNPVADPIREAQTREAKLAAQLKRRGISREVKQDIAYNAGKAIADMFATREEYDAYAENAADLGEYLADFERGVDESFANRSKIESDSEGNNVPLENEPNGENNGPEAENDGDLRQGGDTDGGPTNDEGAEEGGAEVPPVRTGNSNQEAEIDAKYPPRNGDATPQLLIDTFGFKSVSPNVSQNVLNTVYDFMMSMAKVLGFSPSSIGQGGTLSLDTLADNARPDASYGYLPLPDGTILNPRLKLKNKNLSSISHEWFHALDQALSYYETGKGKQSASLVPAKNFTGRPETLEAIKAVLKAINKSGHKERLERRFAYDESFLKYSKRKDEMIARAFEEYIRMKFAEAGIDFDAYYKPYDNQPTPEEMEVIAPAFDNLFKVLQEKDGRTPNTSILYHIAEQIEQNDVARAELGELVADWTQQGGNFVVMDAETMEKVLDGKKLETPEGVVYGFVKDGIVYLNPSMMNPNTSIHEYTHLWDNALMQMNRPLWERGKALMKQTSLWNEVINDPNYADIKDNEDLVASEVHSRLVGPKGAELLSRLEEEARAEGLTKGAKKLSILGRLREWLNEATKWLKSAFSVWSQEELDAVTLEDFLNMPMRDLANFTVLPNDRSALNPENNLSTETKIELADKGLVMRGGAIMSEGYSELKDATGYKTPIERGANTVQFSYGTRHAHIANYSKHPEAEARVIALLERFAERLSMNELVNGVISTTTEHQYGKKIAGSYAGPLRTNVEYIITFDLDTTCPRTFQYLNLTKKIEKRIGRPLTQIECIQLTEMMRMYGQQIPCVYCYAENKRQALKDLYTRFIEARHAVLNAKTDEEALQYMYGHKTGEDGKSSDPAVALNEAAYKVFLDWRANRKGLYNPTISTLWREYRTDRNSVLTVLEQLLASKSINTEMGDGKIANIVAKYLRVSNNKAIKVIEEIVGEWKWNTIEGKEHEDFTPVDEDDIYVNENAFAVWRDMTAYAKSASSAKSVIRYTPYTDELKKVSQKDRDYINGMGGVRMHSTNDFRIDYVFDYFQFMADMALYKMFGHTYTKSPEFVRIFGKSGYRINMSIAAYQDENGNIRPNADEGFDWNEAKTLREQFPDAGVMLMATSDEQIQMALDSDWIDMVIPFHQSGLPKAVWYNMRMWTDYQPIQKELLLNSTDKKNALKADGVAIPKGANAEEIEELYSKHFNIKKVYGKKGQRIAPHFLPGPTKVNGYDIPGHNNDHQEYLRLCREYGVKPRFAGMKVRDNTPEGGGRLVDITEHPRYMILIKETARTDSPQTPVKFNFDEPSEALGGKTPLEYAFDELEARAMAESELAGGKVNDIYNSLNNDQFGIADQFINTIIKHKKETGEDFPLDYITPESRDWFLVQRKALEEAFKDIDSIPYHRNEYDENGEVVKGSYTPEDGILSRSGDITPEMDAEYMSAVERGDMETAQKMVIEAADKYLNEMLLPDDTDEVGFQYHRGPAPTKTFKRYAVFNVKEGGFHAAYAGNSTPTPVGVWLDAQNLESYISDMVQFDDGTFATYIAGDTGADTKSKFSPERAKELGLKGGQKWLLERGGKHSSDVPNFSQMNLGVNENGEKVKSPKTDGALPHNKLIFEIEYGVSEDGDLTEYVRENGRMMKGKNQGLAKIGENQYYDFKTNPNAVGNWGIGGTFRITRLVPYSEVVSVTEQYKQDAIDEANRLYEEGKISKKDRDARVKSAESIQVQKWVGGYNPADFGLTEESVQQMAEEGSRMKLTDAVTYDDAGNVIPLSERFNPDKKDIRYRRSDIENFAVDFHVGKTRNAIIERAVNEEAKKLGVNVTYKTREEMPKGHKNDKGYYNTRTGEIVICTENASSIADAVQTILHEAVAHKGLRQLMGDRFNEFIDRVYNSLNEETKAKVDALARDHYNGNTAVAMEEYMATLAESEDFEKTSVWESIKSIFEDIMNTILGRNDIKIGDNELRYILRASYNNMVNPRSMETIEGWAKDTNMREELGINEATPELLSRTGIDPTEVASETAKAVYDRMVSTNWNEFQRQFQDAYQPVRVAIDAIQQETGNIPIEDYENYLLVQNQASSRSRVEIDNFQRKYYSPIIQQINSIIDTLLKARGFKVTDKAKRAEVYMEVRNYLIAKHGLERNLYYQTNNRRKLHHWEQKKEIDEATKELDDKINQLNADTTLSDVERELEIRKATDEFNAKVLEIKTRLVPDLRDYSGLTSLFGMDKKKYREAEEEARKLVNDFEVSLGRTNDADGKMIEQAEAIKDLWKRLNSATDKTLRHSYECGLLSRQQFEDIKGMFEFYIPLRGFDETTAEDVYAYARFEGNSFNPAVETAKGRTSLADDPIAIIMNMAESEIAQGNKNRAKQALYNFLLNRVGATNRQNSLMQLEEVWYEKVVVGGKETFVLASPDRSSGETYEEFEDRMKSLEATDDAYRSKKGNKVDVGMRFQKQMDKSAHYVYLKVNGVEKAIYINGDPKAAEAINGSYRPKQMYGEEKLRTLNRTLSSTFTNYSLEFTARNFFRDMIYSRINLSIRESDPAYRKKFRQNWRRNNAYKVMQMLKAYRAGEYDGRALTEDEASFVEFMENGGQTGYTVINSVENHKAELERAIKRMQKGIVKGGIKDSTAFRYTLGAIELLNEASEVVTRFAAFKTSRDMGRGVVRAVSDAKEITVNFNTKGAQDKRGWMGFVSWLFGWSKYFFNASVQGVQNLKAMASANKLKFCKTVGGIAGLGFCMPIISYALYELLAGDDENEYWNIPDYDRQNNLCIMIGQNNYIKIPLPIGFREIYAIGDMVAGMAFDKKFSRDVEQVGMDIANKIATMILPINPLESPANGLSLWHTALYTVLPSSMQFLVQNTNNIDWKGAPLQKEYTFNENDPQWMKAYASNPDWMVSLSKWCNENLGEGDFKGVDWSPEKLDNTLSNLFGGIYSLIKKTGAGITEIWNSVNETTVSDIIMPGVVGDDILQNVSKLPLAGVVYGSGINNDEMFVTDAYYDMMEYYDDRIGFIKRRAKKFGYDLSDVFEKEKGKHHPKMQDIYNNDTFDWMQEWYLGNKELESKKDEISRLEKKIGDNEPTKDQSKKLEKLNAEFITLQREFVNDMLELD